MDDDPYSCANISEKSAQYFMSYLTQSKIDSAEMILAFWRESCGLNDYIYQAEILLACEKGSLDDELLTDTVYNYMERFRVRREREKPAYLRARDHNFIYLKYDSLVAVHAGLIRDRFEPVSKTHRLLRQRIRIETSWQSVIAEEIVFFN